MTTKLNKLQTEFTEEKELNKCLASNQELYQSKLTSLEESLKKNNHEKDKEIQDLQLQLRDIMFYLDAQSKMSESTHLTSDEIQSSQTIIQQDEAAAAPQLSHSAKMANRRKRK